MNERARWTDERIDDRFAAIDRTLQRLDVVSQAVASVPERLEEAISDTHECRAGIAELKAQLEKREREREAEKIAALELRAIEQRQAVKDKETERAQAEKDKRENRKWLIGVMLVTAGLTISALALLFGVIGIGTA